MPKKPPPQKPADGNGRPGSQARPPQRTAAVVAAADRNRRRGRSCLLCSHSRRQEFDQALALGEVTDAEIGRAAGLHRSNVGRHRTRHLLPAIAAQAAETTGRLDIRREVESLYQRATEFLARAEATDNWPATRAFVAEARQALETLLRVQALAAATEPRLPPRLQLEIDVSVEDGNAPQLPTRDEALAALTDGDDKDDGVNDHDDGGWTVV